MLPLFGRGLLVVRAESVQNDAPDWAKLVWLIHARDERRIMRIVSLPPLDAFRNCSGRFGAQILHENPPVPGAWESDRS